AAFQRVRPRAGGQPEPAEAGSGFKGGHYLAETFESQLLQPLSQQVSQARRRWNSFLTQLSLHGSQASHGFFSSQQVTGTLRHRGTHTSSQTRVLTFLQTVTGTHSVTLYGTLQVTV